MKRGAKETESADDGMELRDGFTLEEKYFSNRFPQNTEMWRQFRKLRTHLLTRLASSTLDTAPTCSPA